MVARQAPLSTGFPRQEYWSGLPFPPPGDRPNPGIDPGPPTLQADFLPSEPPGRPILYKDDSVLVPLILHYHCPYYCRGAAWAPCWSTVSRCPAQTWLLPMACGTSVPRPGIEPVTSALEDGFVSTGRPGRSLSTFRQ